FVFFLGAKFQSLSRNAMVLIFIAFSVLMGMSMSFVLLAYTSASVFSTFVVTSGTFGFMAVLGYTTKTDLTKFGSILMMGLIGIILASIVNFFMQSSMMEYIISILGVLIFTGLTAYDVQKLKRIGMASGEYQGETQEKLAIMGALTLYLDFINLFLFMLRFMGDRR
ncbi:MAG: Bax inhibitor-1/YccA family protein, partial [Bacteroidales bacterium]|nr:Bax inhibitor-1/YccA family protein [Bacteroidales bacterium]